MHYTLESDTGHMTLMHARLKSLHDSMRARGASETALARLPQLPRLVPKIELPIVLATAKNGTDYVTQARLQKVRDPGYVNPHPERRRHKAKDQLKPYSGVGYPVKIFKGETDPADITRAREIVITAAAANGISPWQIFAHAKPNAVVAVRRHCIKIALELTRLSSARMAAIFDQPDHSTIRHNHKRAKFLLHIGNPEAVKIHAAALAAVHARFPQYRPTTQMQEAA